MWNLPNIVVTPASSSAVAGRGDGTHALVTEVTGSDVTHHVHLSRSSWTIIGTIPFPSSSLPIHVHPVLSRVLPYDSFPSLHFHLLLYDSSPSLYNSIPFQS